MSDKASKTEDPTPKRLSDAKKKGQVAKSPDFNSAISLFAFVMLIDLLGQYLLVNGTNHMKKSFIFDISNKELTVDNLGPFLMDHVLQFALMVLPFLAIALLLGVIVNIVQTGFLSSTEPLKPDFNRINPIQGFKNIFSGKALFNLVKNLLKLILVFYMTYSKLVESAVQILNTGNLGTEKLFFFLMNFVKELGMDIAIIMLVLGVLDFVMQKRDHKKNLRMSKQEIKDEYKEMEGDPQIKSARKQKHQEMSMGRMMEDIPGSTVVITNPTHIAIVIRYDDKKDQVPLVTAKGADYIAEKIREIAKDNDIPIIENKPLARTIYKEVEVGDHVPTQLYKAVAEILALVYEINKKKKHKI